MITFGLRSSIGTGTGTGTGNIIHEHFNVALQDIDASIFLQEEIQVNMDKDITATIIDEKILIIPDNFKVEM